MKACGLQDARSRAAEYRKQLEEIDSANLRRRFLIMVSATDPEAASIMRRLKT